MVSYAVARRARRLPPAERGSLGPVSLADEDIQDLLVSRQKASLSLRIHFFFHSLSCPISNFNGLLASYGDR